MIPTVTNYCSREGRRIKPIGLSGFACLLELRVQRRRADAELRKDSRIIEDNRRVNEQRPVEALYPVSCKPLTPVYCTKAPFSPRQ